MANMKLNCNGKQLDLEKPVVMGILNVTPDSFSDGGRFRRPGAAVAQAQQMAADGAAIIDIGGESTRPGAAPVGVEEELERVIPVVERLTAELEIPLSVDTSKPQVMQASVAAGAGMINDVKALQAEGALHMAASLGVPVCLMHMQGEPRTMQASPHYQDVVAEVGGFLETRIEACVDAGIVRERIIADPGFGFGKSLAHNLLLLRELERFQRLGVPLMAGISRKSMIGLLTGRESDERLAGSLAAAVMAVERGAAIVRVHDVAPTVDALKVATAVMKTLVKD